MDQKRYYHKNLWCNNITSFGGCHHTDKLVWELGDDGPRLMFPLQNHLQIHRMETTLMIRTRNLYYNPDIDLTNAISAKVTFYAKWDIEANYDYVQFQVSTNGGNSWVGQCGLYTVAGTDDDGSVQPDGDPVYEGVMSDWVLEDINLSDYLGQVINVRFRLRSDGGVTEDGYYFDDFKVFYNEAPQGTAPESSFTPSSYEVCLGSAVSFNDFSSEQPTDWFWDFGDGSSSNDQNPSHTYSGSGPFVVTLTVSNEFWFECINPNDFGK